jgi:hypothetical protein
VRKLFINYSGGKIMETFSSVFAPYIGANGNWYVDNEDTGVKAQGPKGDEGPVGGSGAQGLRGIKGETGDRGPQGIQGPVGATGAQGPKGDTGAQGPKGDTPALVTDLQTTSAGKALDATMGKVLNDKISSINNRLDSKIVIEGSVLDLRPGEYYCAPSVIDLPGDGYYYVKVMEWSPDKFIIAYSVLAAGIYKRLYTSQKWNNWIKE